jgi:hypothetical protein
MEGAQAAGRRWGRLWERVKASPRMPPSAVAIPPSNDLDLGPEREPFEIGTHYLSVDVDQIFLRDGREWLSTYQPLVSVMSELAYDGAMHNVPFVVGAPMLADTGYRLPEGMLFTKTRVAGPHPYKGAGLNLTVILYKVETKNYGREILNLTQGVIGSLNFATGLLSYVNVANTLFDGVEALVGRDTTMPVVGSRHEFESGGGFTSNHHALIDATDVDPTGLWVKNGTLMVGPNAGELKPYRKSDFVLYSVKQSTERDDLDLLPTARLWQRVRREAAVRGKDGWGSAEGNMLVLYQELLLSPDLTERQAEALATDYNKKMVAIHDSIPRLKPVHLGDTAQGDDAVMQRVREKSVAILSR